MRKIVTMTGPVFAVVALLAAAVPVAAESAAPAAAAFRTTPICPE